MIEMMVSIDGGQNYTEPRTIINNTSPESIEIPNAHKILGFSTFQEFGDITIYENPRFTTLKERDKPQILNGSRKKRIAKGSATSVQEVNQLIQQFTQMKKMMGVFNKQGMGKSMEMIKKQFQKGRY